MLLTSKTLSLSAIVRHASGALFALSLAACGGGGGSPGGAGSSTGSGSGSGSTAGELVVKMTITDGTGKTVNSLSGGQSGTVKATVTDAKGAIAADAIVAFSSSDATLVSFKPAASAITDKTGVAVVNVVPASLSSAGATTLKAEASVSGKTGSATANIAVGAAPLTVGTLAFSPAPSGPLPAFSTLSLAIPVSSGGAPATSVSGMTLNSLCVGDGTATLVAGSLANGVQSATYTNNGCTRGRDTLTVAIGNSSQTIGVDVSAANIGTIQFVGSNITGSSIVLKGSGGLGRSEAAQLTFKVVDQHNTGLPGVDVNFTATTYTGGLTVSPTRATTDAQGNVSTQVSSGTIPTPVRVIAEATRNGVTISGLSDALTISTGLPIQKSMSMAADSYNIEGLGNDGVISNITVSLADQYGNRVSDGTAVNFVTEGGAVASSLQGACTTVDGECTVKLKSQEFRPTNGRVTVLAYVQGIEDFVDANGDGQYSCTNYTDAKGAKTTATYRPLVDICVSGGEDWSDLGDAFLDAGKLGPTSGVVAGNWLDSSYDPANGDLPFPYNHSGYSSGGDGKWGINYIRRSIEVTFSGSTPTLVRQFCSAATGACRDWVTSTDGDPKVILGVAGLNCASQQLMFRLYDANNNPMPSQTTVSAVDTDKLSPQTFSPDKVPSTNAIGGTIHSVTIKPDTACAAGSFSIKVTTPKGLSTLFPFKSN